MLATETGTVNLRRADSRLCIPFAYQQEVVGEIRLAPRASGEPFSRRTCVCLTVRPGRRAWLFVPWV